MHIKNYLNSRTKLSASLIFLGLLTIFSCSSDKAITSENKAHLPVARGSANVILVVMDCLLLRLFPLLLRTLNLLLTRLNLVVLLVTQPQPTTPHRLSQPSLQTSITTNNHNLLITIKVNTMKRIRRRGRRQSLR